MIYFTLQDFLPGEWGNPNQGVYADAVSISRKYYFFYLFIIADVRYNIFCCIRTILRESEKSCNSEPRTQPWHHMLPSATNDDIMSCRLFSVCPHLSIVSICVNKKWQDLIDKIDIHFAKMLINGNVCAVRYWFTFFASQDLIFFKLISRIGPVASEDVLSTELWSTFEYDWNVS